jgi:hypothetical protein
MAPCTGRHRWLCCLALVVGAYAQKTLLSLESIVQAKEAQASLQPLAWNAGATEEQFHSHLRPFPRAAERVDRFMRCGTLHPRGGCMASRKGRTRHAKGRMAPPPQLSVQRSFCPSFWMGFVNR